MSTALVLPFDPNNCSSSLARFLLRSGSGDFRYRDLVPDFGSDDDWEWEVGSGDLGWGLGLDLNFKLSSSESPSKSKFCDVRRSRIDFVSTTISLSSGILSALGLPTLLGLASFSFGFLFSSGAGVFAWCLGEVSSELVLIFRLRLFSLLLDEQREMSCSPFTSGDSGFLVREDSGTVRKQGVH